MTPRSNDPAAERVWTRPGKVELRGARVVVQPIDWSVHGAGLFGAVAGDDNVELWDYMPFGPFASLPELEAWQRQQVDWETMVILEASHRQVLGMASYMRIREAHGSAEVGCVTFGRSLQRTAEATEAMALMACHVFDDLGYRRYEWKCDNANQRSKRAALRLGFQHEGVFRNDMLVKGRNRDTAWYSIIDREWPAVRAALQRWLSPDNFDAAGRQRKRLQALRQA